mmetsp:Transcript_67756/g.185805  ORF Transcript_67756/g.185805 Transcript_67756/m.185805 type:complete len:146 (-) Transcript_67756:432-869(-)
MLSTVRPLMLWQSVLRRATIQVLPSSTCSTAARSSSNRSPRSSPPAIVAAKRQREVDADAELSKLRRENAVLQSRLATGGAGSSSALLLALTDKREPCGKFNTRGGCDFGSRCKYAHVCDFVTKTDAHGGPLELCRGDHPRHQHP